ncbi:hypothetical protein Dimus_002900 [Dionaea muscipula]
MNLEGILKVVSENGGGHMGQSFQVLLESTSDGAEVSDVPKKIIRTRKTKKAASKVAVVGDEEVPTEGTVGGTQESQTVATKRKSKPKTKPRPQKKDVISPAVGENEVEIKTEGDSEDTQSDEVAEKVVETEETFVMPVMIEEGQPKKRRLKQAARTGPATNRVRKTESPQPESVRDESSPSVSEGAEEVGTAKNASSPTAVELEVEMDSLLGEAIHHSFISDLITLLNTLMQDQREKGLSGFLCIPLGPDGGMSYILRETEGIEDPKLSEINAEAEGEEDKRSHRDGKKAMVVNEEDEDEDTETPCRRLSSRDVHMGILSKRRLRIHCRKMLSKYVDALLGSTNRGARMTSAMAGHAIQRTLKVDMAQHKSRRVIRELKEENQTLEKKIENLQRELEKEKEGKTKKDDELLATYSKYHDLLRKQMDLDTSLDARKRENEKLQMSLTQTRTGRSSTHRRRDTAAHSSGMDPYTAAPPGTTQPCVRVFALHRIGALVELPEHRKS